MSDRLLVATRKGLFTLLRRQSGWEVQTPDFLGDRVSAVCKSADGNTLIAALDLGHFGVKFHRSLDQGKSWKESPVPKYPKKPESAENSDRDANSKKEVPWKLELAWILEAGGASDSGGESFWCGTIPGGLFHSEDAGESWQLVESLWKHPGRQKWFGGGYDWPGIHSLCIDPRDQKQLMIGVSCGGVWKTRDRGANWETCTEGLYAEYMPPDRKNDPLIQDPHCLAQCTAHPDIVWMQHHNGMFRSENRGQNWVDIGANASPSSFGFAVAAHPQDPKVAWFVPAISDQKRVAVDGCLRVLKTQDGGQSFESCTEGLPQKDCYDLIYRHALDVDTEGKRLAMASTTGSLWISEDSGRSWNTVSAHLPPIVALRFL